MRRPLCFTFPPIFGAVAGYALLFASASIIAQQPAAPTPPPGFPTPLPGFPPANFGRPFPPGFPHPTFATPTATPSLAADAELISHGRGSLVFVESHEAAGSGFICDMGGQKFLVTNAHVLAGHTQIVFTLLDGAPVPVGAAASAVAHDMVRLVVSPNQAAFSALEKVDENLLVGDEVLVLGNARGARVINPIDGRVVGVGPNLVEIDAPFQHGNSGSPIIQKKTGKVVGIASYVIEEHDNLPETNRPESSPRDTPPPQGKVRRFGYRLDSVKAWQPVAWPEFQAEAAAVKKIDQTTNDFFALINDIHEHHGRISDGIHQNPLIQRPLQTFFEELDSRPSPTDALRARQTFLDALRRGCQGDVASLRPRLQYDYFQRSLVESQRVRDSLAKSFDEAVKAQTNSTHR